MQFHFVRLIGMLAALSKVNCDDQWGDCGGTEICPPGYNCVITPGNLGHPRCLRVGPDGLGRVSWK